MFYFFDGTIQGFLTAFVAGFCDENAYVSSKPSQLSLGESSVTVVTDLHKAEKAKRRLLSFDKKCLKDLYILLRSGEENSEQIAFEYLRFLAQKKRPVRNQLSYEIVFEAINRIKRVGLEIHRMHGFIRFTETASGALYAPFSPDHDICDLLLPHFRARLPLFPFVLHDVKRKKAAVYDGKNTFVAPLEHAEILLSANEEGWQALWKRYYASVYIPSRTRLKQMRGYMPQRYQKFMLETQTELSTHITEKTDSPTR